MYSPKIDEKLIPEALPPAETQKDADDTAGKSDDLLAEILLSEDGKKERGTYLNQTQTGETLMAPPTFDCVMKQRPYAGEKNQCGTGSSDTR